MLHGDILSKLDRPQGPSRQQIAGHNKVVSTFGSGKAERSAAPNLNVEFSLSQISVARLVLLRLAFAAEMPPPFNDGEFVANVKNFATTESCLEIGLRIA